MVVGNGKKFAFPVQYPFFTVSDLALRAMAVATRVITDRFQATTFAHATMAPQGSGSTYRKCFQGLFDLNGRIELLLKPPFMNSDNIG